MFPTFHCYHGITKIICGNPENMNPIMNFNFNPDNELAKQGPKIYFRGVNRIHVNRFKAYLHILSNRLKHHWQITDLVSEAQAVITYEDNASDKGMMHLNLYADTANHASKSVKTFQFDFDENRLIKQLNRAGNQLSLLKTDLILSQKKKIKIFSHNSELTKNMLNSLNGVAKKFKASVDILSENASLFIDHLLLLIDATSIESVHMFYQLEEQRRQNNLTVNEFTVAILHNGKVDLSEQVFDEIYEQADSNTQITLLNKQSNAELNDFVKYF